MAMNLRVVDS